jgi:hypothetical protein
VSPQPPNVELCFFIPATLIAINLRSMLRRYRMVDGLFCKTSKFGVWKTKTR